MEGNKTLADEYKPIEVTTHNIYFHEDSPVLSTDNLNDLVATSGNDAVIRLWKLKFKRMGYRDNVYRTAANSSIEFEYIEDLKGFVKPVNCVRFFKESLKMLMKNSSVIEIEENILRETRVLAGCSDGGRVVIFVGSKPHTIRNADGDDAYDICWGEENLFVTFSSGRVEVYRIDLDIQVLDQENLVDSFECNVNVEREENENCLLKNEDSKETVVNKEEKSKLILESKLIVNKKIHESSIQGVYFNKMHRCIATHSTDKKVKVNLFKDQDLVHISTIENKIDNTRGLFKRLLFDEEKLFVFHKNNMLNIYAYPFRSVHLHKTIGPLNSAPVKIIEDKGLLFICTKSHVYVVKEESLVVCIENTCFMSITDGFVFNDTLFVSSMDGFIASVRLNIP